MADIQKSSTEATDQRIIAHQLLNSLRSLAQYQLINQAQKMANDIVHYLKLNDDLAALTTCIEVTLNQDLKETPDHLDFGVLANQLEEDLKTMMLYDDTFSKDRLLDEKQFQSLMHVMVGKYYRNNQHYLLGKSGKAVHQSWGSLKQNEADTYIHESTQTPSQYDKYSTQVPNLATVTVGGQLLFTRSAKSDSVSKLGDLLVRTAIADLMAQFPDGTIPEGYLCKVAINSFMDNIIFKGAEVKGIDNINGSIEKLFGSESQQSFNVNLNGHIREIKIQKPLFMRTSISEFSAVNLRDSQVENTKAVIKMGMLFAEKLGSPIEDRLKNCLNRDPLDLEDFITLIENHKESMQLLTHENQLAYNAIRVTLFGKSLSGKEYNKPKDGPQYLVLLHQLMESTGYTPAIQCKSGQDRTGTIAALLLTTSEFKSNGIILDPDQADLWTVSGFKEAFTRHVRELCVDPHHLTRYLRTEEFSQDEHHNVIAFKPKKHPFFKECYMAEPNDPLGIKPSSNRSTPSHERSYDSDDDYGGGGGGGAAANSDGRAASTDSDSMSNDGDDD